MSSSVPLYDTSIVQKGVTGPFPSIPISFSTSSSSLPPPYLVISGECPGEGFWSRANTYEALVAHVQRVWGEEYLPIFKYRVQASPDGAKEELKYHSSTSLFSFEALPQVRDKAQRETQQEVKSSAPISTSTPLPSLASSSSGPVSATANTAPSPSENSPRAPVTEDLTKDAATEEDDTRETLQTENKEETAIAADEERPAQDEEENRISSETEKVKEVEHEVLAVEKEDASLPSKESALEGSVKAEEEVPHTQRAVTNNEDHGEAPQEGAPRKTSCHDEEKTSMATDANIKEPHVSTAQDAANEKQRTTTVVGGNTITITSSLPEARMCSFYFGPNAGRTGMAWVVLDDALDFMLWQTGGGMLDGEATLRLSEEGKLGEGGAGLVTATPSLPRHRPPALKPLTLKLFAFRKTTMERPDVLFHEMDAVRRAPPRNIPKTVTSSAPPMKVGACTDGVEDQKKEEKEKANAVENMGFLYRPFYHTITNKDGIFRFRSSPAVKHFEDSVLRVPMRSLLPPLWLLKLNITCVLRHSNASEVILWQAGSPLSGGVGWWGQLWHKAASAWGIHRPIFAYLDFTSGFQHILITDVIQFRMWAEGVGLDRPELFVLEQAPSSHLGIDAFLKDQLRQHVAAHPPGPPRVPRELTMQRVLDKLEQLEREELEARVGRGREGRPWKWSVAADRPEVARLRSPYIDGIPLHRLGIWPATGPNRRRTSGTSPSHGSEEQQEKKEEPHPGSNREGDVAPKETPCHTKEEDDDEEEIETDEEDEEAEEDPYALTLLELEMLRRMLEAEGRPTVALRELIEVEKRLQKYGPPYWRHEKDVPSQREETLSSLPLHGMTAVPRGARRISREKETATPASQGVPSSAMGMVKRMDKSERDSILGVKYTRNDQREKENEDKTRNEEVSAYFLQRVPPLALQTTPPPTSSSSFLPPLSSLPAAASSLRTTGQEGSTRKTNGWPRYEHHLRGLMDEVSSLPRGHASTSAEEEKVDPTRRPHAPAAAPHQTRKNGRLGRRKRQSSTGSANRSTASSNRLSPWIVAAVLDEGEAAHTIFQQHHGAPSRFSSSHQKAYPARCTHSSYPVAPSIQLPFPPPLSEESHSLPHSSSAAAATVFCVEAKGVAELQEGPVEDTGKNSPPPTVTMPLSSTEAIEDLSLCTRSSRVPPTGASSSSLPPSPSLTAAPSRHPTPAHTRGPMKGGTTFPGDASCRPHGRTERRLPHRPSSSSSSSSSLYSFLQSLHTLKKSFHPPRLERAKVETHRGIQRGDYGPRFTTPASTLWWVEGQEPGNGRAKRYPMTKEDAMYCSLPLTPPKLTMDQSQQASSAHHRLLLRLQRMKGEIGRL